MSLAPLVVLLVVACDGTADAARFGPPTVSTLFAAAFDSVGIEAPAAFPAPLLPLVVAFELLALEVAFRAPLGCFREPYGDSNVDDVDGGAATGDTIVWSSSLTTELMMLRPRLLALTVLGRLIPRGGWDVGADAVLMTLLSSPTLLL